MQLRRSCTLTSRNPELRDDSLPGFDHHWVSARSSRREMSCLQLAAKGASSRSILRWSPPSAPLQGLGAGSPRVARPCCDLSVHRAKSFETLREPRTPQGCLLFSDRARGSLAEAAPALSAPTREMTAGQALFGEKGGDAAAAQRLGVEAGALESAVWSSLQESRWHSLGSGGRLLGPRPGPGDRRRSGSAAAQCRLRLSHPRIANWATPGMHP